ncbi:MAG: hypothetical protein ACYCPW_00395 [Nitrososphaerales archaeon]
MDWRLRKFRDGPIDYHPVDPNWETGKYIVCHRKARELLRDGLMVFDVVHLQKKGVIRSAFEINHVEGNGSKRILHFDRFWYPFSAQRFVVALPKMVRTNPYRKLSEHKTEVLLARMKKKGYVEYKKGETPLNVNSDDWTAMIREGRKALKRQHRCP